MSSDLNGTGPYYVIARDKSVPLLYGPFEDRYAANRRLRTLPDDWQRWTVRLTAPATKGSS